MRTRKLSRTRDARRLLIKNLATALFDKGSLMTTLPKAKAVLPYSEKLITKAKKNNLHNRRQIISKLTRRDVAHRLVDEIAPSLTKRSSGHLKIERYQTYRQGDGVELVLVYFVDSLEAFNPNQEADQTSTKAVEAKPEAQSEAKPKAKTTPPNKKTSSKKESKK